MLVELEQYEFTKEAMQPFNKVSGIYGLIYDNEVIYVGQSVDLGRRLKEHRRENQFENTLRKIIQEQGKCNRCKQLAMYDFINQNREDIEFIILRETTDLNKYEKHYIELFQPRYNYKGVDVPY